MSLVIDNNGTQRLYTDDTLIGVIGINIRGKIGMFIDEANGLCEHESVSKYCELCRKDGEHLLD